SRFNEFVERLNVAARTMALAAVQVAAQRAVDSRKKSQRCVLGVKDEALIGMLSIGATGYDACDHVRIARFAVSHRDQDGICRHLRIDEFNVTGLMPSFGNVGPPPPRPVALVT